MKALEEFGQKPNPDEISRFIGMGGNKIIPTQTPWNDQEPKGQALAKRRGEVFEERYLQTLNAFRGAHELVRKLHDQGLKLAVASTAQPKELDPNPIRPCQDMWIL